MPESLEIDVDQLMEHVRSNSGQRRSEVSPPPASTPLSEKQMPADIDFLHDSYDIYHLNFTSHRKGIGRVVILIKNALRQLLTPILERQLAFNAATARVAAHLWEQAEARRQGVEAQGLQHATALEALRAEIVAQMGGLRQQQDALSQTLRRELEGLGGRQEAALQALRTEMLGQVQEIQGQVQGMLGQVQTWEQHMEQRLGASVAALERAHQERTTYLESALAERDRRLTASECECARLKTAQVLQERRLTMLLEEARRRLPAPLSPEQLQTIADEEKHVLEALYLSFEDQFRGTREDIKERLRVYLPLLREAKIGSEQMPILDVGCGRGEWLELLQEEGLRARGVDVNRVLSEECRRRGLEVIESEGLAYLSSLPPQSLGAVTGFHVIEHLPFEVLIKLLDETVRVLKPGGVAIFETPNPENVLVGSHNFYLDPTHRNPLPSSTMRFLAEARALCRVEIMTLHPYPEFLRLEEVGLDIAKRFNKYFYGPQDYAVVGWKAT